MSNEATPAVSPVTVWKALRKNCDEAFDKPESWMDVANFAMFCWSRDLEFMKMKEAKK